MLINTNSKKGYLQFSSSKRGVPSPLNTLKKAIQVIELWSERRQTRTKLKSLTAAELRDIGISQEEAKHEARRPFYDI